MSRKGTGTTKLPNRLDWVNCYVDGAAPNFPNFRGRSKCVTLKTEFFAFPFSENR
jgi:hypothetical protein